MPIPGHFFPVSRWDKLKFLFWSITEQAVFLLSIFPSKVPHGILQPGSEREIKAALMGKCQHIETRKE